MRFTNSLIRKTVPFILLCLAFAGCKSQDEGQVTVYSSTLDLVPVNSMFFCEVKNPHAFILQAKESPVINSLGEVESISALERTFGMLRRIAGDDIISRRMTLAGTSISYNSISWMIITDVAPEAFSLSADSTAKVVVNERTYDKYTLQEIKSGEDTYYCFRSKNLVMLSTELVFLEESLLQINTKFGLSKDENFLKGYTANKGRQNLAVYLNMEKCGRLLQERIPNINTYISSYLGGWILADLALGESTLTLNGFITEQEGSDNFMSVLLSQKSTEMTLDHNFPVGTVCYTYYNITDWPLFFKQYTRFLKGNGQYNTYTKRLSPYSHLSDGNHADFFASWVTGGIASVRTFKKGIPYNESFSVFAGITNPQKAKEALRAISPASGPIAEDYRGMSIMNVENKMLFAELIGKGLGFGINEMNYYAVTNHAVVFSYNLATLKGIIDDILDKNTLGTIADYQIAKANIHSTSNMLSMMRMGLYAQVLFAESAAKRPLTDNFSRYVRVNAPTISMLAYNFFQITAINNVPFVNLTLFHSENATSENKRIWSYISEKPIRSDLYLFPNHRDNNLDIVYTDSENNINLVSASGNLHWKKDATGEVLGGFYPVDMLRNGRFQMAYATKDKVHVLDRNGVALAPFPVSVGGQITTPLNVFDYDKNRSYRFAAAVGNRLVLLNANGRAVTGFDFKGADQQIISQPTHLRVNGKDYIVMSDQSGMPLIINRVGDVAVKLSETVDNDGLPIVSAYFPEGYALLTGERNGDLFKISATGKISRIKSGTSRLIGIKSFGKVTLAYSKDRIVVLKNGKLSTIDVANAPLGNVYYIASGDIILYSNDAQNKIYAATSDGKAVEGFPMAGSSNFTIGDIDKNKKLNLVSVMDGGRIVCYELPL